MSAHTVLYVCVCNVDNLHALAHVSQKVTLTARHAVRNTVILRLLVYVLLCLNSGAARLEYQNKREEVWRRKEGAAAVEVRRKTKLSKPYAAGGPGS